MEISGIILAGGESQRMGQDKAMLSFWGKPFIEHVLATMRRLTNRVWISANSSDYDYLGVPVIEDELQHAGPLAGLCASLKASKTDWNYIITCDTPLVSHQLYQLFEELVPTLEYGVVAQENEQVHPLIGMYHKRMVPLIEEALAQGKRSVLRLCDELPIMKVSVENNLDFYTENLFLNANTPREYEKLKEMEKRIKILYFGVTGEIIGRSEDYIDNISTVEALKEDLFSNYPRLKEQNFKIAVNQVLVSDSIQLRNGDEVALLPPFAGG